MKPLKRGRIRSELADALADLMGTQIQDQPNDPAAVDGKHTFRLEADQIAAIIGGAVDEALFEVTGTRDSQQHAIFWRYLNHNLWNLTRSLRASNLLGKV